MLRRSALAAWLILSCLALSAWGQSAPSAPAPAVAKISPIETLMIGLGNAPAAQVSLGGLPGEQIEAVREANTASFEKRLQIGVGRPTDMVAAARGTSLQWRPVNGGLAAQWEILSPNAAALRVGLQAAALPPGAELRFGGWEDPTTIYGPFRAAEIMRDSLYWSPVLEGERATVEIFLPDGVSPADVSMSVALVSHLFVSPSNPYAEVLAKAAGACEVNLICRSTTDTALASVGRAVARMSITDSLGNTGYCTGTLVNTTAGPVAPYFYTAAHCVSTQTAANGVATQWFYDSTSCSSNVLNPSYVQVAGGATLMYADTTTDVSLLRLNSNPPPAAVYAGWSATTLGNGTPLTAVHHPAADLKKVSLGTAGGFSAYGGGAGSDHLIVLWNALATGVTEGGSSGSAVFTAVGSPATDYQLRGGLHGGPSSCSATGTALRDYYSRFDQAYPFLSQYLSPSTTPPPCTYALAPTSVSLGSAASSGSFTVTTGSTCSWIPFANDSWITTSRGATGSGSVVYTVAANGGAARTGTVTLSGQTFTINQAAPSNARLVNLSTRMQVLTGNDVMIGGFIIGGSGSKQVVVRARGPSLASAGITNFLSDPVLTLVRSSNNSEVATNDDWTVSNPNASLIQALGFAPSNAFESAILVTLPPGGYTAIVSGYQGATGVGLVEVFEVDAPTAPLINIATRGRVLTGNDVMIAGFIIQGTGSQTVVVRANGPSLASAGITSYLSDPVLTLVRSSDNAIVATNDDWTVGNPNASQIQALGFAPSNGLESAILATLPPGAYTAIVSGYQNATGVGLVEVFVVQ